MQLCTTIHELLSVFTHTHTRSTSTLVSIVVQRQHKQRTKNRDCVRVRKECSHDTHNNQAIRNRSTSSATKYELTVKMDPPRQFIKHIAEEIMQNMPYNIFVSVLYMYVSECFSRKSFAMIRVVETARNSHEKQEFLWM